MVRQKIPVVAVIGNDAAWTQIRRGQVELYGAERAPATSLDYTRYDKVVEALGGFGAYVETRRGPRPRARRRLRRGQARVRERQDRRQRLPQGRDQRLGPRGASLRHPGARAASTRSTPRSSPAACGATRAPRTASPVSATGASAGRLSELGAPRPRHRRARRGGAAPRQAAPHLRQAPRLRRRPARRASARRPSDASILQMLATMEGLLAARLGGRAARPPRRAHRRRPGRRHPARLRGPQAGARRLDAGRGSPTGKQRIVQHMIEERRRVRRVF